MNHNEIINYIDDYLISNTTNQLISKRLKLIPEETLQYMKNITPHLPSDTTLNELLYNVKYSVTEKPKCICGKQRNYMNFKNGYAYSCGSSSCAAKMSKNKANQTLKENQSKSQNNTTLISNHTLEELKEWIKNNLFKADNTTNGARTSNSSKYFNKHKKIFNLIFNKTKFLDKECSMSERIYCILNDITSRVMCKECNVKPVKYVDYNNGYKQYCSNECSRNEITSKKIKETTIKKYGVDNVFKSEKIKKKIKETTNERYPDKQVLVDRFLKTMNSKTPDQMKDILEKRKKTNIMKYGVDCVFKDKNIIDQNPEERKRKQMYTQKLNYYNKGLDDYEKENLEIITAFNEYFNNNEIQYKCKMCNTEDIYGNIRVNGILPKCIKCNPSPISKPEKEILEYVNKYDCGNKVYTLNLKENK